MADNWLPPHARVRVAPRKDDGWNVAWWVERCGRAVMQARMELREIFLEPRGDTGEWDSGARGL